MKQLTILVLLSVIIYLFIRYFSEGLDLNTRGISFSKENSVDKGLFIHQYKPIPNAMLNSVLGTNVLHQIWIEKSWFHKRWGNFEISTTQYSFIAELQGNVNNDNYSKFNRKWNIQLADKGGKSALTCTRNKDKFILIAALNSEIKQDTIVFNVKNNNVISDSGEIKFLRLQ